MSVVIICRIRRPFQELRNNMESAVNLKTMMARNRKITKSIVLIVAIFNACFTPFSICWVLLLTCIACNSHLSVLVKLYGSSLIIMVFNSCLNPFLYAFRIPKFRKPIALITKRLFCCCCKPSVPTENDIITTNNSISLQTRKEIV